MKDPYKYFRIEAREIVDSSAAALLELEKPGAAADELVQRLLRLAHTLKGAARVVKRPDIAEEAHALEDELEPHRGAASALERAAIDPLLARVDRIRALVAALAPPPAPSPGSAAEPAASPAAPVEPSGVEERIEATRIEVDDVDALLESVLELRAQTRAAAELLVRIEALSSSTSEDGPRELKRAQRELTDGVREMDGAVSRLEDLTHKLRLVSARSMLGQLERAVRDAARVLNKKVVFETKGGDNRFDAEVLTRLRDGLLHLVRNAVDHGIEPPAERLAAGKPEAGTITIELERRGEEALVICADDGRGLDVAALSRRGQTGKDAALIELFRSGVSTRREVTEVSGRGVGVDTVREIVRGLRGQISVTTEPARGTRFEISVPVSLSSMGVLAVETGGTCLGIPLVAVRETARIERAEVAAAALGREAIVRDGKGLPVLMLGSWLRPESPPEAPERFTAVVLEVEGRIAAVGVDRLVGNVHRVVRPIPKSAGIRAAIGASFDADGTPQPVLDPAVLIDAALQPRRSSREASTTGRSSKVLVIDDSLTTRMLEESILTGAGFDVDLAASAEEGLEKAGKITYDLFIVDVDMPGMDGFEFVARTKGDPKLRDIPSIIVTSRSADADRRRGIEVGARAYVVKSDFAQEGFLELVRSLTVTS